MDGVRDVPTFRVPLPFFVRLEPGVRRGRRADQLQDEYLLLRAGVLFSELGRLGAAAGDRALQGSTSGEQGTGFITLKRVGGVVVSIRCAGFSCLRRRDGFLPGRAREASRVTQSLPPSGHGAWLAAWVTIPNVRAAQTASKSLCFTSFLTSLGILWISAPRLASASAASFADLSLAVRN